MDWLGNNESSYAHTVLYIAHTVDLVSATGHCGTVCGCWLKGVSARA